MQGMEFACQNGTIAVGQGQVDDGDIDAGGVGCQKAAGLGQGSSLSYHGDVRFLLQREGQRLAEGAMIIDEQEAYHETFSRVKLKLDPVPGMESAVSSAPWAATIRCDR